MLLSFNFILLLLLLLITLVNVSDCKFSLFFVVKFMLKLFASNKLFKSMLRLFLFPWGIPLLFFIGISIYIYNKINKVKLN